MTDKAEILRGIAVYKKQQQILLRLMRLKGGSFTEHDFDRWYKRRNRIIGGGITGDSFLIGIGANGFNEWAEMLDILQYMIRADLVDAKTIDGVIIYSPIGDNKK